MPPPRWNLSPTSWWMGLLLTCVVPPCCGARPKDCPSLPLSNTWRPCGRSWMPGGHSVPWASTHWPSPACVARTSWMRSNHGHTCAAAMCMATMAGEGAVILRSKQSVRSGSAPCAVRGALMCHCGLAASRGSTSMRSPLPTPLSPVATFVQKKQLCTGARSRCHMAHMPSMPPAHSASSRWAGRPAVSNWSSKARWIRNDSWLFIWSLNQQKRDATIYSLGIFIT